MFPQVLLYLPSIVLEKELCRPYKEIDMVTTPTGHLVAMAHSNNCTSDLNAWVNVFKEFAEAMGMEVDMNKLFGTFIIKHLKEIRTVADFCPTVISQVSI